MKPLATLFLVAAMTSLTGCATTSWQSVPAPEETTACCGTQPPGYDWEAAAQQRKKWDEDIERQNELYRQMQAEAQADAARRAEETQRQIDLLNQALLSQ